MNGIKTRVVKGAFWIFFEKLSLRAVSFCVTLVLARLLSPSDYGTVALLTIFIAVMGSLVDAGFGSALVQKKDATELDFNSVFYLSLALSLIAYLMLFALAPCISEFYNIPELKSIVRVLGIQLIFNAVNSVQSAELTRKMLFNLSFRISLLSTLPSAIVGVVMAYKGFGAWALVAQSIASGLIGVIARWVIIAWRPKLMFSFAALKGLFSFGWKISLNSLIEVAFENTWGLIVGKVYHRSDLAFINKGRQITALAMDSVSGTLSRVSFPALAQLQDDQAKIREATRRIVQLSSFLVVPMMMGLATCSKDIIYILFGGQWDGAVPYAQLACFQFALWPLSLVQMTLMAMGHSDILVKINLVRKAIGFAVMGATLWISPLVFMAAMAFVYTPVCTWTNAIPNKKLLNYTLMEELRDVVAIFSAAIIMAGIVMGIGFVLKYIDWGRLMFAQRFICLVVQILAGVGIYFTLSVLFKIAALGEILRIVVPKVREMLPRLAYNFNRIETYIGQWR